MSTPARSTDARPQARKDEWALAAEKGLDAVESAGSMASHAGAAAQTMAGDAVSDLGRRANNLAGSAGAGIKDMGDRLSRNGPQDGILGDASHAFGKSVRDGGQYLENAKLSGIGRDIGELVRKNPLPAVCIAFGIGWFLASKMR